MKQIKAEYESIVRAIVRAQGGFREKDILSRPYTIERTETWNDEHKVLNVISIILEADGRSDSFAVDIVTRKICG